MEASADWVPDVLGDEFEQLTLPLGSDDEGVVVATLVRAVPSTERGTPEGSAPSDNTRAAPWWRRLADRAREIFGAGAEPRPDPFEDVDVLYVHGWSDYFFQKRLARTFTSRGARFYALDLRKYGRSLRDGQTPGFVTTLDTYDEDIAAALAAMGWDPSAPRTDRRLVLFGHSTGGLTLSLWASRHPGVASAVILNSPWLEFHLNGRRRTAIAPLVDLQARHRPMDRAPQVDLGFYTRAQHEVADPADPVEVNLDWRPERAMTVYAGWLDAVLDGHALVAKGLAIDAPICVLLSARWEAPIRWSESLTEVDSVLVVDDIARAALNLGPVVTICRIDGALHDVFLSQRAARETAYWILGEWVDRVLTPRT